MLLSLSHSNAQVDSTTGNLVNFTGTPTATTGNWVNGVYVNQLCFHAGEPDNCGPNPSIRAASGSINFSYGTANLNQLVNINHALSEAGTGVQLSGFNFGFRAKNGNGWDDGRQDYLSAYVKIYDSTGKVVENYDYTQHTNSKYNWSDFNFTETFNKPYITNKLGAAQFGFIGRDNNFWAGNYGPEISNVSFSLNYRIDPCATNPASSPSCPGFSNLVKTPTITIPPTTFAPTTIDTSTSSTPTINVGGVQLSTTGNIAVPDNIPQSIKDVQAATQQSVVQVVQPATSSKPSMSLIMSVIGQVQAADRAVQAAAVQNANQTIAASTAKSQEQAMAAVDNLNVMSAASSQASLIQTPAQQPSSAPPQQQPATTVVQLQGPAPTSLQNLVLMSAQPTNATLSVAPQQQTTPTNYQAPISTGMSLFALATEVANKNVSYVPATTQQQSVTLPVQQPIIETPTLQFTIQETKVFDIEVPTMVAPSMSRGSVAIESPDTKINTETVQQQQTMETVKKNVAPNDLAGGVDIASIATQPKGYDLYSQLSLRDASFYKVEDIYKNQKTIDNVKLLRGLRGGSDKLHQEMVDQQYQLGK